MTSPLGCRMEACPTFLLKTMDQGHQPTDVVRHCGLAAIKSPNVLDCASAHADTLAAPLDQVVELVGHTPLDQVTRTRHPIFQKYGDNQ